MFCFHCRSQNHSPDDEHEVIMIDELIKEVQHYAYRKAVPQMLGEHTRTIDGARKKCLAGLANTREAINRTITEAEEWVVTHFGDLEHKLEANVKTFQESLPTIIALDMNKSTSELNSKVLRMVQSINNHRRSSASITDNS